MEYLPIVICILGLALWLVFSKTNAADPWGAELGRIMFFVGLFVSLIKGVPL